MRLVLGVLLVAATTLAVPGQASAAPIVITFENLSVFDAETDWNFIQPLASQFAGDGVEFLGGAAWFAGWSLNETDFPPHSGEAAASNATRDAAGDLLIGAIDIAFTQPFYAIGGYFTYDGSLSLEGFNGADSLGTLDFTGSNLGMSSFIEFTASLPITRLLVTGGGNQFTLDDLTLNADAPLAAVPEPASILLLGGGLAALWCRRRTQRRS